MNMVYKLTAIPMPAQVTENVVTQLADVCFTKFKAYAAFRSVQCVGQPLQVLVLVHPAGAYVAKKLTRCLQMVKEGSIEPQSSRCPLVRFLQDCQCFDLLYDGIIHRAAQIDGITAVIPCYIHSSRTQLYKRFPKDSFVTVRGNYQSIDDALARNSHHAAELDSESETETDQEEQQQQQNGSDMHQHMLPDSQQLVAVQDNNSEVQQLRTQLAAAKQEAADSKARADQLAAECQELRSQLEAAQQQAEDSKKTAEQLRTYVHNACNSLMSQVTAVEQQTPEEFACLQHTLRC